jgi:hypothetical protein
MWDLWPGGLVRHPYSSSPNTAGLGPKWVADGIVVLGEASNEYPRAKMKSDLSNKYWSWAVAPHPRA